MTRYKIKKTAAGHELLQDGEWLQTFATVEQAEAEKAHRERFDRTVAERAGVAA